MSAVPDDMGPWVKQLLHDMGQSDAPDMLVSTCVSIQLNTTGTSHSNMLTVAP